MRYWEILVFCLGISLDVFGAAVCQGAVLGELRRRRIALYCLIFCAAQVAAMEIGGCSACCRASHRTIPWRRGCGIFSARSFSLCSACV